MFDLGVTNLLLPLVRGAFVAALFSAFGALVFIRLVAPQGLKLMGAREADAIEGRCLRLARVSLAAALFGLLGWLALEASDMSDAANATDILAAIPTVLLGTSFGHDVFAQALSVLAALLLLTAWPQRWRFAAVGLVGLALALQTAHSHAFAMEHGPSLLLYAEGLHLVAGGAWLGGLLPLLVLVRDAPPEPAAETLGRFSGLATFCVAAIAGTACFQGWVLGGGVAGLIGTAYGWVLLLKAALFAVLLGLAAINRFRLTPALERRDAEPARWALMRTIAGETVIGLMVVLAAGALSGLEPGMHARPAATIAGALLTMP
ncbi:CopD family protein [Methyloceanibacter sp.]|uniref:CopD family protein n=1 Tax=Methyloceanibacter sp. TaxID=1965321 RepID=UPI003D6D41D2